MNSYIPRYGFICMSFILEWHGIVFILRKIFKMLQIFKILIKNLSDNISMPIFNKKIFLFYYPYLHY